MSLTHQQLETIIATALPGEQLKEWRTLPRERYGITLAGGERLDVQSFDTPDNAATAIAALRRLRGEVDLPLPQLRASDATGEIVGVPYALLSPLNGEPLTQVVPRLTDEQLYELGRRIGEVAYRVHRLACEQYGALTGEQALKGETEREYVLARLERELHSADQAGMLDQDIVARLQNWFDEHFQPAGSQAALISGNLALDSLLVVQNRQSWSLGGVIAWEQALGWSPAWEHVIFLEAARAPRCFSLRVGYGNGYDAQQTQRTYEQVREPALRPYRLLLVVHQLRVAHARGDRRETERRQTQLAGLLSLEEAGKIDDSR